MRIETVQFKITEGDIRSGTPGRSALCAGSLSIRRRLGPGAFKVNVDHAHVSISWLGAETSEARKGYAVSIQIVTPTRLNNFAVRYDADKNVVKPMIFSLTMEVPDDWTPGPLE